MLITLTLTLGIPSGSSQGVREFMEMPDD